MGERSGDARQRLARHLAHRRRQLRMSQTEAAEQAGVKRNAWWVWEKGRGLPYDYNHAGIETALRWEPGSVQAILDGDKPAEKPAVTPIDPDTFMPPPPGQQPDLRDDVEREMWTMTAVSDEARAFYINQRRTRRATQPTDSDTFVPPPPGQAPDLHDHIEWEMWAMTTVGPDVRALYINQRRQRIRRNTNESRETG